MTAATLPAIYAEALLDLLPDADRREALLADAAVVDAALRASPELVGTVTDPRLRADEAKGLLRRCFADRVDPLLVDWLCLLVDRDRFRMVRSLLPALRDEDDRRCGRVAVTVTTALPCDGAARRAVEDRLRRNLGAEVRCRFRVDPAIVAGAVVRYGDTRLDGSASRRLDELKDLVATAPMRAVWDDEEDEG